MFFGTLGIPVDDKIQNSYCQKHKDSTEINTVLSGLTGSVPSIRIRYRAKNALSPSPGATINGTFATKPISKLS